VDFDQEDFAKMTDPSPDPRLNLLARLRMRHSLLRSAYGPAEQLKQGF
jgi:hypothetical protein